MANNAAPLYRLDYVGRARPDLASISTLPSSLNKDDREGQE